MGKVKALHHRGSYQQRAKHLVDAAYANPGTRCARCGLTLAEHPLGGNGKPQFWTAGHVNRGEIDGPLRPEASRCNFGAGNVKVVRYSRIW